MTVVSSHPEHSSEMNIVSVLNRNSIWIVTWKRELEQAHTISGRINLTWLVIVTL